MYNSLYKSQLYVSVVRMCIECSHVKDNKSVIVTKDQLALFVSSLVAVDWGTLICFLSFWHNSERNFVKKLIIHTIILQHVYHMYSDQHNDSYSNNQLVLQCYKLIATCSIICMLILHTYVSYRVVYSTNMACSLINLIYVADIL